MWHFVLLWLTCDALIIQRYVKIMTCTDLLVSFRLLVYTRCLFSRLLRLGGGVYDFFWRSKLMNCTNILALCVCCSIWGEGDEVVQLGEEGSALTVQFSLGIGIIFARLADGERLVVLWSGSWIPGWIPTLGLLKWYRIQVHELLIQVLSSVIWKTGWLSNLRNSKQKWL